jgi:hypothetical protein
MIQDCLNQMTDAVGRIRRFLGGTDGGKGKADEGIAPEGYGALISAVQRRMDPDASAPTGGMTLDDYRRKPVQPVYYPVPERPDPAQPVYYPVPDRPDPASSTDRAAPSRAGRRQDRRLQGPIDPEPGRNPWGPAANERTEDRGQPTAGLLTADLRRLAGRYRSVQKAAGTSGVVAAKKEPRNGSFASLPEPPAAPVQAPTLSSAGPRGIRQRIDETIRKTAAKYDLPVALLHGVVQAESSFQVDAVSPAGAQGLMQLMPDTARELGVTDPFDIEQNIDGGARYLRRMLDMFDGDTRVALMAYNAGPGTARRYNGDVPYRETRHYVERVLRYVEELA